MIIHIDIRQWECDPLRCDSRLLHDPLSHWTADHRDLLYCAYHCRLSQIQMHT
jgi:hypothetical protein